MFEQKVLDYEYVLNATTLCIDHKVESKARITGHTYLEDTFLFIVKVANSSKVQLLKYEEAKGKYPRETLDYLKEASIKSKLVSHMDNN